MARTAAAPHRAKDTGAEQEASAGSRTGRQTGPDLVFLCPRDEGPRPAGRHRTSGRACPHRVPARRNELSRDRIRQ
jgi:hypothetical protein